MALGNLLGWFGNILKIFNSPLFTVLLLGLLGALGLGLAVYLQMKPAKRIWYFDPDENRGEVFKVERTTPAHIYTKKKKKDKYRFIRFREAFNFTLGMRAVTIWLGRRGTAYVKRLESDVELGDITLFEAMKSLWGDEVIDSLIDKQKQKLIESEVMVTVKLEKEITPKEYKPVSELYIKKESDEEMARIFGENIKKDLFKEDWIRTVALVGCGVGLCYALQAIGILGGIAT